MYLNFIYNIGAVFVLFYTANIAAFLFCREFILLCRELILGAFVEEKIRRELIVLRAY